MISGSKTPSPPIRIGTVFLMSIDTQAWPEIELPNKQMLLNTLLHTKDSAPGPDGLPYAAWRLLPEVTVEAMMSYFYDIFDETALPPLQVGNWDTEPFG